jgi:hypothetical protein
VEGWGVEEERRCIQTSLVFGAQAPCNGGRRRGNSIAWRPESRRGRERKERGMRGTYGRVLMAIKCVERAGE